MAVATAITRYTAVMGPFKMEVITCTMANNGDHVVSRLQRPVWATAQVQAAAQANSTAISGKTVTVTNSGISASTVHLLIFGF